MIDNNVINYIRNEIAKGTPKEEITKNLTLGGWTLEDIQENFSHIGNDNSESFTTPVENKPKPKMGAYKLNFLIFIGYYILGVLFVNIFGDYGFGTLLVFYGYIIHAVVLILLSIAELIRGISKKIKTNAGQYFLSALLLLLIGFGSCTLAFTSGILKI